MYDLVLRNGLLITSDGPIRADVAVHGEAISAIGQELSGRRIIDATDCYLLPGAIDQHVHMQMPLAGRVSSDSFATGTLAAACGGTTTIIDFVAPDAGQGLLDALAARRAEADGQVVIDYGLHMTIPTWHAAEDQRMSEIPATVAAGCPTFKMYQAYPDVMLDDASLLRAMQRVAAAGGSVVLHSETGPVLDVLRNQALAQGHTEAIWHERTRPARLEATAIQRAAELAHLAGCRLLIFHVGCAESVIAIAEARRRGIDISGESCPQYLLLNADDHLGGADGNLFICAPPLRSTGHQPALWQALADDDLQVVSTDHCPWTRAEKAQANFTLAPGGVPSIECRLALLHHFGVNQGRLSLERWVQVCCTNPARLMGLTHKGRLAPGCDADIVVFDPVRRKQINKAALHEAADWTPYAGIDVVGWSRTVLLRGQVIVEDEHVVGQPGVGRFVARKR